MGRSRAGAGPASSLFRRGRLRGRIHRRLLAVAILPAVFADTGMAYADRRADVDPADWVSSARPEVPGEPICGLERLDEEDRYYAVVEIVVEPLSVEEVRDLERWLQGNLREGDGQ